MVEIKEVVRSARKVGSYVCLKRGVNGLKKTIVGCARMYEGKSSKSVSKARSRKQEGFQKKSFIVLFPRIPPLFQYISHILKPSFQIREKGHFLTPFSKSPPPHLSGLDQTQIFGQQGSF